MSKQNGVSIGHFLTGTISKPTHVLSLGESIPPSILSATRKEAEGKPYSIVLVEAFGTIREKRLEPGGK